MAYYKVEYLSLVMGLTTCGDTKGSMSGVSVATTTPGGGPGGTVLSSGQYVWTLPLLSANGPGVGGWEFGIQYLRYNGIDGVLGPNWNYTQNIHLEEDVAGSVVLVTGENFREPFEPDPHDPYRYLSDQNNTAAVLTRSRYGQDEFTLTSSKGNVTKFYGFNTALPGRIKSITDRYGNTQTFVWTRTGAVDQLLSVTDGYGRTMEYRYYGSEGKHRLREIEDFLGRKLNFQYDGEGRLAAVVLPSIAKGAEGNTFPGGTAYVFEYDTANPRGDRRDDLIRVWFPNQAAPYVDAATRTVDRSRVYSEAKPRYEVAYGQTPGEDYGRVIRAGRPERGSGRDVPDRLSDGRVAGE